MHKRLLQLIRDNARRESSPIKTEIRADGATIYLYDVIDPYFGIGSEDFNKELAALKGTKVQLRINSPGGDVFEARAMATAIAQHGDVHAYIDGLAASAATYIGIAAKTVQIAEGAFFMIHNAWTFAYGNKADLINTADLLDKVDQSIIADYARKTGKSVEEIAAWMNAETWFTAQETVDHGFADSIFKAGDAPEQAQAQNTWNLKAYSNAPKALVEPKPPEPNWAQQVEANRNRLRLLEVGG